MPAHRLRGAAVAAFVVFAVSPALAQDTPIRSVRLTVAPKTRNASVTIQNLRTSALMAWRIETPGSSGEWNSLGDLIRIPNFGPIAPHETRTVPLSGAAGKGAADARITAAIFADGYYEGTPAAAGFLLKSRQDRAERLAFWLDAFDKLPRGTEKQQTDYLMAKIVESAGQAARWDNVGAELRRRLTSQSQVWLVSTIVDDFRPKVEAALREVQGPAVRAPEGAPSGLKLSVVRSDRVEYVVQIENLRNDAAIEAWLIGAVRNGSLQPLQGNDACLYDPSSDSLPGPSYRIAPHHSRSMELSLTPAFAGSQIQLVMVLFDDLSFEGAAEHRDRVLAQRARLAVDYAYWLAAYRDAAAVPVTEVKALLEARRAERARQKAAVESDPDVSLGGEAIGALNRSPETFPAWLNRRIREIEGAYARMTRHLER